MTFKSDVIRSVLLAMGERELAQARRVIPSRTLKAALSLIVEESELRARVFVPHYWAIYLHDGRGSFNPRGAQHLVFFDNPKDDPRRKGARKPERFNQERRLTPAEYRAGLDINAERLRLGLRPFMYVVRSVGPQRAKPWFERMALGASNRAGPKGAKAFDVEMQKLVDTDKAIKAEKRTAKLDLG